jgi:rhodanese-related sulfurtransferase
MDGSTAALLVLVVLVGYFFLRGFLGKVAPLEAQRIVADGGRLVDVRSPAEHRAGHIRGSTNIPVGELGSRLSELGDKSQPVVVYCASGMRSASAASLLRRSGFQKVYDLGAMARWPG